MARRVYLHIGAMKSATTYLQDLCDLNADDLADAGIFWSEAKANFLATDDLLGTSRERPGLEGAWATLDEQVRVHPGDALISNELLSLRPRHKVGELVDALSPAEVQVVITARDLGRVIPSQWQTGTRNKKTSTWSEFTGLVCSDGPAQGKVAGQFWRRHDIPAIIARWQRHVPVERITLVTVPPAGSEPTMLSSRFASALSIDGLRFEQPTDTNPSLGAYSAELMRRLNEAVPDIEFLHYHWGFKNAIGRQVLPTHVDAEPAIALTDEQHAWAVHRGERMIEQIKRSGVVVIGDLDDLIPVRRAGDAASDPGAASDGDLLDVATYGLTGLAGVVSNLRIEHDSLVRAVESLLPADEGGRLRREFDRIDALADPPQSEQTRDSRFLRWRIEQMGVS